MDHYRDWQLCRIGGGPPSKWLDEPAVQLDWLIEVDKAVRAAEAAIERRRFGG